MKNQQSGFTLLELLTTMAIISILAAIAIPQYAEYKKRGFDVRSASDLRNVATAEEAYFLDFEEYLSCLDDECETLPGIAALSKGVTLQITSSGITFVGTATHDKGTGKVFEWNSEEGGLVE